MAFMITENDSILPESTVKILRKRTKIFNTPWNIVVLILALIYDFTVRIKSVYMFKQLIECFNSARAYVAREIDNYKNIEEARKNKNSLIYYGEKLGIYEKIRNTECPICLEVFKADDKVRGLQCSPLHIYHQKCLN